MDIMWKAIDYLMDFQKVRMFQELCGLKESAEARNVSKLDLHGNTLQRNKCIEQTKDFMKDGYEYNYLKKPSSDYSYDNSNKICQENYSKMYEVTNWFLFYLFQFGSTLGHEVFYITFIPCIYWNLDPVIARRMVVVWVVTMYIGQALKEIIKWPRPSWPPVFKLETRVQAEYGIPSTHAVAGTALPFSFLMAMYGRYEFAVEFGIVLACSWCLLVGLSRLYVGMHSILDVIAGISLAAIYLLFGWGFMDMIEEYTMTSTYSPAIIILSHFLLGVFYPNNGQYSTSRGDTVIILGAGAGIHVATWVCHQYGFQYGPQGSPPYPLTFPVFNSFLISFLRALIGFIILFAVRTCAKSLSLSVICWGMGASPGDRMATRRKDIEVPYKFFTYTAVGFSAFWLVPYILESLQITH